MTNVEEMQAEFRPQTRPASATCIQPSAYLLELSLDWIVLRASENAHRLLGESHVTLVGEPLGRFVHSEALHDLRNLFSRLSGTLGIARAYRIRLTDDPDLFDIAFQLSDGRVLLEAVRSPERGFGEAFGTVGGLIAGLGDSSGQALLDGGARRMRALTGFDRVTLEFGAARAESSRAALGSATVTAGLPTILCDAASDGVAIFPREAEETSAGGALMRSPSPAELEELRGNGIGSALRVPFTAGGEQGEFRCASRAPHKPGFELHSAAELFAQLFALRLEIDRLKSGD